MEEEQFEKHAGDESSAQDLAELEHARLHAEGIPHSHSHTHSHIHGQDESLHTHSHEALEDHNHTHLPAENP